MNATQVTQSQLLSFEVTNFRSIYDTQRLDLVNRDHRGRNTTAIYGPNSSGKSNIYKALAVMQWFIVNSTQASVVKPPYEPFLLRDHSTAEPSSFKIELAVNGRRFRYSFSINHEKVMAEKLIETSEDGTKPKVIFKRDENKELNSTAIRHGFGKKLIDSTLDGSLLLTKARENNNEYANLIFNWFVDRLVLLDGNSQHTTQWSIENIKGNNSIKKSVLELVKKSDLWIQDFEIEEVDIPDEVMNQLPFNDAIKSTIPKKAASIKTKHTIRNKDHEVVGERFFELNNHESAGTEQFFSLAAPILYVLDRGLILYLDEFGVFLHPEICQFIVSLFKNPQINEAGAQLIINTHDTSLMSQHIDLLKREDIYLTEKNYMEETILTPLTEKPVREGESLEKRYREGLYGATPHIGE